MTARWIIPSVDVAYRARCVATLDHTIRRRLTVVDNTGPDRLSVAASWNAGIDAMTADGADWLVICSESMRFGRAGGLDFEAGLLGASVTAECDLTCTVVETTGQGFCRNGFGWHIVALSADLIAKVGRFDERFVGPGFEDADYLHRMVRAGYTNDDSTYLTRIDAHLAACEHSVAAGFVTASYSDNAPLYEELWGGPPGAELW